MRNYGYIPGTIIQGMTIAGSKVTHFSWGKELILVPVVCRLCGEKHTPVIEEANITIMGYRHIVVSAGECKDLPAFAEESVVKKQELV